MKILGIDLQFFSYLLHEVEVQIKKLEKFQYCFCLEKHSYKIYKTYNHEFGIKFLSNIYSYDLYYRNFRNVFQISLLFCYKFSSLHYARENLLIYNDNLMRFCRILALK